MGGGWHRGEVADRSLCSGWTTVGSLWQRMNKTSWSGCQRCCSSTEMRDFFDQPICKIMQQCPWWLAVPKAAAFWKTLGCQFGVYNLNGLWVLMIGFDVSTFVSLGSKIDVLELLFRRSTSFLALFCGVWRRGKTWIPNTRQTEAALKSDVPSPVFSLELCVGQWKVFWTFCVSPCAVSLRISTGLQWN